MTVQRRTMKFLIPLTIGSLGRTDLTGRAIVPLYINPQTFGIDDTKIINETLTKGGYAIHYWGEELGQIQASGTTGSGGIEAINILRGVYRNEITQFNNILLERAVMLDQNARASLDELGAVANAGAGIISIVDTITKNGFSGIVNGASSVIEEITNAAQGIADNNSLSVELIPTIGAFATSMILYWQGEKFTGYFKNFGVDESASTPGHFEYKFTFMITKRTGTRSNFMPWHRKPTDSSGNAVTISTPNEGQKLDELSFPTTTQQSLLRNSQNNNEPGITNSVTSSIRETQESNNPDINLVSINRNSSIKGS